MRWAEDTVGAHAYFVAAAGLSPAVEPERRQVQIDVIEQLRLAVRHCLPDLKPAEGGLCRLTQQEPLALQGIHQRHRHNPKIGIMQLAALNLPRSSAPSRAVCTGSTWFSLAPSAVSTSCTARRLPAEMLD